MLVAICSQKKQVFTSSAGKLAELDVSFWILGDMTPCTLVTRQANNKQRRTMCLQN